MTDWGARDAVAAEHDGAEYHMRFFGEVLEQRTPMTTRGLEVAQTTPFSRATILLRWQSPLTADPTAVPNPQVFNE